MMREVIPKGPWVLYLSLVRLVGIGNYGKAGMAKSYALAEVQA